MCLLHQNFCPNSQIWFGASVIDMTCLYLLVPRAVAICAHAGVFHHYRALLLNVCVHHLLSGLGDSPDECNLGANPVDRYVLSLGSCYVVVDISRMCRHFLSVESHSQNPYQHHLGQHYYQKCLSVGSLSSSASREHWMMVLTTRLNAVGIRIHSPSMPCLRNPWTSASLPLRAKASPSLLQSYPTCLS